MTDLRVYLPIHDLQPQFAAYLASPIRARGYPPIQGDNSLIIEVAPALAIHRIVDLALKAEPDLEPGILYVERQFGVLELHAKDKALVERAGAAILRGTGAKAGDQLAPTTLYADIIERVADQHAIILAHERFERDGRVHESRRVLVYHVRDDKLAEAWIYDDDQRAVDELWS